MTTLRTSTIIGFTLSVWFFTGPQGSAMNVPDTAKPVVRAVRIDGDLQLTGDLSDPRWRLAVPIELNYETQPGENIPAPQKTKTWILYNADYVYFGFECKDTDPSAIRAHITDRDKLYDDDFVGIILDTYGDFQRSYEFFVNPFGIQADLLRTGNNEDDSFDTVWKSAAATNGEGWTVEMAIPFKSLRFPSRPEQKWAVFFGRIYPRASRALLSWTPIDRNDPCFACQGGFLEGIRDAESVTSVDLLPYVVGQQSGSVSDNEDATSPFENGKLKGRVGGGIRYSPGPDFAVEAVVNPDFSQVETDAAQISVNSTFALFYPEKRPFFLLGADMLQNQIGTFYSRSINNPIGGARVIGKSGSLSYTYLAASDRNTPYIVPGEEGSDVVETAINSFSNVARVRYDFGKESFAGAMITARNTSTAHNYVAGVDWNMRFWDNHSFRGELFTSDTKELNDLPLFSDARTFGSGGHNAAFDGERYGGTAMNLSFQREARDYSFSVSYQDRSPGFQAHNGFVPSNNLRIAMVEQQYTFYPNNALADSWSLFTDAGLHFNYDGMRKELWFLPGISAQLKSQTNVTLTYFAVNNELFKGIQFNHINRIQINVNSRPISALALIFNGSLGRFINRSDIPDLGSGHTMSLTAQIRPTSQLQIELSYSRAKLTSIATGELFFDGYIARTVGTYLFTSQFLLRVIGQYDQFNKAFDFYPLFSYKLNPYTICYAGSTYSLVDYSQSYGVRMTARQFFLKLQYLIRS